MKFINKFGPKDIIAIMVVGAFIYLKMQGLDGTVNSAFFLVLGYYFAKRVEGKDGGL